MNIGIVCFPTFGGSGVVATELGVNLARRGHEVHFITYERPERLDIYIQNVFFHEVIPSKYSLFKYAPYESALASRLVDVTINESLDILHVHYAIPHASVAYMAKSILKSKGYNLPILTTLHGTDITLVGKEPSLKHAVEFSINQSDGVTCVSEFLKSATLHNFNITRDIDVIYNFIDFDKFHRHDKEHFKMAIAPNDEKIIIHVSNFRPVKRAEDVIHVFNKIREEIPSKLLMVGDGPQRSKLEILCRDMGICQDIRFLGKQGAIEELLSIGDLFILPSESESFGLAALEAMALEIPVISSNAGGLPEVNKDGVSGYISPVGDIEDMAQNALRILSNDNVHQRFRKQALQLAREFNVDTILPQYIACYEKILVK